MKQFSCLPGPTGRPLAAPMSTVSQPRSIVPASVTTMKQRLAPGLAAGWQQAPRMRTGLPSLSAFLS